MKIRRRKWIYLVITTTIISVLLFPLLSNPTRNMTSAWQILTYEIQHHKSPSVQYFFFDQDSIIDSFQLGFSDIADQKNTDSNTSYTAFSVTKTFTALAVLQLADKGKIDINKPVIQYLSNFPYGNEITVKQLLSHTAGIPNPIPISWIHLDSEHDSFNRDSFFKAVFEKNNKVKSKPNEKYAYSNLGYIILGQLIEMVSGETYEKYITDSIIRKLPISPDDLTFELVNKKSHATGYHKRISFSGLIIGLLLDKSKFMNKPDGRWRSFNKFYVNGVSYGGLIGKPLAFVKYIQSLLKAESSLISDAYKQLLFEENRNNKNEKTGMCLSWFSGELNGVKYFAHAGGGGGYYCEIRIYPEINKGSVVFFNRTGMTDERFLDKLDRFNLNNLLQ